MSTCAKITFESFSFLARPGGLKVEQESERIGKDAIECQIIADDAQADLAVAMPALERAMAEVDKLDKTSITEVRYPPLSNQHEEGLCLSAGCIGDTVVLYSRSSEAQVGRDGANEKHARLKRNLRPVVPPRACVE